MTTETVLTDEQVGELYQDWYWFFEDNPGSAGLCIRAIEQAVLQSPEIQGMIQALQLIARYPATRDEEMSMNSARATARHALSEAGKSWRK